MILNCNIKQKFDIAVFFLYKRENVGKSDCKNGLFVL